MVNFLNWRKWEVTKVIGFEWGPLLVEARYLPTFKGCPDCAAGPLHKHGKKTMDFADAPVRGQPVTIRVEVQRYRCQSCKSSPLQPLPDIDPSRRMTKRCTAYIRQQVRRKTFAEVARETGVNEKTIRGIAGEHRIDAIELPRFAPRILGIDEVKVAGKLRGIFTDLEGHHVLDVIESSTKSEVVRWLSALEGRDTLVAVCIDGWAPYRDAVREVFGPNVQIVSDKFHILRTANHCMHMVQKQIAQRERPVPGRDTRRRQKRELLKRKKNLSEQEQVKLDKEIRDTPLLKTAYEAKEAFFAIYALKSRHAAESALAKWEAGLTPDLRLVFKALLTTVKNWRSEILAYWDHDITNAFTEAMNGQIKRIALSGRGYSFPELRTRILDGYRLEATIPLAAMLKRAAKSRA
jgi:transposase